VALWGVQTTWVDWVTMAGVVGSAVGLFLGRQSLNAAKEQLTRTEKAAEAASRAASEAKAQYRGSLVLLLLEQLQALDREMELAVLNENSAGALYVIRSWRQTGGQAVGFLHGTLGQDHGFLDEVRTSVLLASGAKQVLVDGKKSVKDATKLFRESMGRTCNQVGEIVALVTEGELGEP
jgi:hypothetical protein